MALSRRHFLTAGAAAGALALGPFRRPLLSAAVGDTGRDRLGPVDEFTPESRRSIDRGNEWLKRAYNHDNGCGFDIGTPSDISCSAMVALAFLSQGSTPYEGPLSRFLQRSERYLLGAVDNGLFQIDLRSQVRADLSAFADHHFAALALSQSLGQGVLQQPVRRALEKLVVEIGRGQQREGHWGAGRYPPLAAVCGWVSLYGANSAGVRVQANADTTAEYLIQNMRRVGMRDLFGNASGIRVLYAMQMEHTDVAQQAFDTALRFALRDYRRFAQFGGEQYLAFHFINEAMLQRGDDYWWQWFPVVRDKLIEVQNSDGSWTGYSCITSRTFCTACALLVLTSPNRYLPISQV